MPERFPNGQQILEMMRAFQPACVIGAAAELDVWGVLGERIALGRRDGEKARRRSSRHDHAAWMPSPRSDLLVKEEDRYRVPAELRPLLTHGTPQTVLPMVLHSMNILRSWSQLAWVTKAGIPGPHTASIRGFEADRAAFIAAMHTVSTPWADDLVAKLGPPKFQPSVGCRRGLGHVDVGFSAGRARRESHDLRSARRHRTSPRTAGKIGIRRAGFAGRTAIFTPMNCPPAPITPG